MTHHHERENKAEVRGSETAGGYLESCRTDFWAAVFEAESGYLAECLQGCRHVLSVGCGPAIVEKLLCDRGFLVTGLDVSREALEMAPDEVRTIAGNAEDMPLPDGSFDAVVYVASLQFIGDCEAAIRHTSRVLRPGGRLVAMLLNPESGFFREQLSKPDSYVRTIKHTDLAEMKRVISRRFDVQAEYFLGIRGEKLFDSSDPQDAALYILNAGKHP